MLCILFLGLLDSFEVLLLKFFEIQLWKGPRVRTNIALEAVENDGDQDAINYNLLIERYVLAYWDLNCIKNNDLVILIICGFFLFLLSIWISFYLSQSYQSQE